MIFLTLCKVKRNDSGISQGLKMIDKSNIAALLNYLCIKVHTSFQNIPAADLTSCHTIQHCIKNAEQIDSSATRVCNYTCYVRVAQILYNHAV